MSNRIKDLREAAGLTQADVAHRLGMSLSGYQRKETAKRGMSVAFANRLAQVLGVSAASVLEAASVGLPMTAEQDELLRLWARVTAGNRDAIMRMLRLAAAEDQGGLAESEMPAPAPRRRPFGLHDDQAPLKPPGRR